MEGEEGGLMDGGGGGDEWDEERTRCLFGSDDPSCVAATMFSTCATACSALIPCCSDGRKHTFPVTPRRCRCPAFSDAFIDRSPPPGWNAFSMRFRTTGANCVSRRPAQGRSKSSRRASSGMPDAKSSCALAVCHVWSRTASRVRLRGLVVSLRCSHR